jgi:FdrA protein
MIVIGQIKRGAYFDSVTLMRCGKDLAGMNGVADAAVVMGTKSNRAILQSAGLLVSEFDAATDTDLLIAVRAETVQAAETAMAAVDGILKQAVKKTVSNGESRAVNLEGAIDLLPGANMALISVAGRYAGAEAMKALERGLHVMLFSDNVPLETEIELKRFAKSRGLLVMGPDCGTAIINGIPLAFANVVNRGDIGIVAAAGTGLQEVSCVISNAGTGISQAIGTGGRDVKKEVGGVMFIEALQALARDEQTHVILLVSKPPHKEVLTRITKVIKGIRKPVVSMFIGADTKAGSPSTLEEAALTAVAISQGGDRAVVAGKLAARDAEIRRLARREAGKRRKGQRYVRGLFSGGTFCAEAQILFKDMISGVFSNAPAGNAKQLTDSLKSRKNTVIDLGQDEFTVGRPHPMIDYSLRNRRILEEANDPETAVILLDVVLGYGSNADPASELSGVIREASKRVRVVCSITGTDRDPQNRSQVEKRLKSAGAITMPTNAAACKLAGSIIQSLGNK